MTWTVEERKRVLLLKIVNQQVVLVDLNITLTVTEVKDLETIMKFGNDYGIKSF